MKETVKLKHTANEITDAWSPLDVIKEMNARGYENTLLRAFVFAERSWAEKGTKMRELWDSVEAIIRA